MMVIWIVILCTLLSDAYAGECTEYYPCTGTCTKSSTTKCGWWGRRRCDKTTYYSCEKTCSRQFCCKGYTGNGCNTPKCFDSTSCPNGGRCVSPDMCTCPTGFSPNRCNDINECTRSTHGCKHNCVNTHGSYDCTCRTGYTLNTDLKSCIDVNECHTNNGECDHTCINSVGSYSCDCKSGYQLNSNGKTCSDIDECIQSTSGCTQTCSNSDGSFECGCNAGYVLDTDAKTCNGNYIVFITPIGGVVDVFCVAVMLLLCTILIRRYRQSAVKYSGLPGAAVHNALELQPEADGTHAPSIQSNLAWNSGGSM